MKTVYEPARELPVLAQVDVAVAGGGPAGFAAAVAAARQGASTWLVEQYGFLGGMVTAGLVLSIGGFNCWIEPYERVVAGIAGELIERAAKLGGAEDNEGFVLNTDPEVVKLVCDEMVAEAGVHVLLHSCAVAPYCEGARVRGLIVENKSGRGVILAHAVVDATGDADIATRAGAPFRKSPNLQPMTLGIILGHVHGSQQEVERAKVSGLKQGGEFPQVLKLSRREDVMPSSEEMRQAREAGRLPVYGGPWFAGLHADRVWVNSTRLAGDASDAESLARAEIQGRRDAWTLWRYFRENVPALQDSVILSTGPHIGIRETRQIVGDYQLTAADIRNAARFVDAVALGCWPIDVHPPDNVGVHGCFIPRPYQIPYRVMLPLGVEGLLVAGRSISATQEAMGSTRVAATCMALGQAAGVAAALAACRGVTPRLIDVPGLQASLCEQGTKLETNAKTFRSQGVV